MLPINYEGILWVSLLREEVVHKLLVVLVVLVDGLLPLRLGGGEVAQEKLPADLSDFGDFVWDSVLDERHELFKRDFGFVEETDQFGDP